MPLSISNTPLFPYLQAGPWQIGAYPVQVFGLMVWLGLLVGAAMYIHRANRQGLDQSHINDLFLWGVGAGLILSHAFYFWIYHPGEPPRNMAHVLNVFDGMSSMGGLLGFMLGIYGYVRWNKLDFFRYADAAMWGTVHGWIIARLGCSFAHDHPGKFTDFWFSVRWPLDHPDQRLNLESLPGRHDLGLDEMLLTAIILLLLYLTNARGQRFPGFTIALTFTVFAPVRFWMDFLRVNDIHYAGLTPAQYVTILMFFCGLALFVRRNQPVKTLHQE